MSKQQIIEQTRNELAAARESRFRKELARLTRELDVQKSVDDYFVDEIFSHALVVSNA